MGVRIDWLGVIENYLIDGDIRELERLIREGGVPAEHGSQVADILTKKLKAPTPAKAQILKRKERYMMLVDINNHRKLLNKYVFEKTGIKNGYKKLITRQAAAIDLYPLYSPDNARNELRKFKEKHNLPEI